MSKTIIVIQDDPPQISFNGFLIFIVVALITLVVFMMPTHPATKYVAPTHTVIEQNSPVQKSVAQTHTEIAPPRNICTQEYLNSGTNRRAMESECSDKCLNMEPRGTLVYQDLDCIPPDNIQCKCKSK